MFSKSLFALTFVAFTVKAQVYPPGVPPPNSNEGQFTLFIVVENTSKSLVLQHYEQSQQSNVCYFWSESSIETFWVISVIVSVKISFKIEA